MAITPVFPPTEARPRWQLTNAIRNGNAQAVAIKDNFLTSTWLCLGGLAQGLAIMLFGSAAMLPGALLLLFRMVDALLISLNITKNRYAEGVIWKKWGAQIPHDGTFGAKPAEKGVVVFLVGIQINHPLGIFAPGAKENTEMFDKMAALLENFYDKNGLLGCSHWSSMDERAGNMPMFVTYWRDMESLHHFAHSKEHMDGIRWWAGDAAKKYPHIGVWHETFSAPAGHYENVYLNCKPFLMGANTIPVAEKSDDGTKDTIVKWQSPIVDSKRGPLRTFARRIRRQDMTAHEREDGDVWDRTHQIESKSIQLSTTDRG